MNLPEFSRNNFVAALCFHDVPQAARARGVARGPYTHNQYRHAGRPIVLHTDREEYRAGKGREVAFMDDEGGFERILFVDRGVVVAQKKVVPTEADLRPFAQHVAGFLYFGESPEAA